MKKANFNLLKNDALMKSWQQRAFPFRDWLKGYDRSMLRDDTLAGLSVAAILIPQAMAYAMLAGLPPIYGLYAAAVTPFIASLWGSLRQLSTGPIAITSLLVLTTLTPYAEPGSAEFIELAILLSFMVGVIYLLIGILRLGLIMSFISHSAVTGFTSAAAFIIIAAQLPHLMGVTIPHYEFVFPRFVEILIRIPKVNILTLLLGVIAFAIIYGLKRYKEQFPSGLIAIILATAAVFAFRLHDRGIAIVGESPSGLPHFHLPQFDPGAIETLLGSAFVIALVSFAETYSISKTIAARTKQKLDVNQEFIGQGMANFIGSFFRSYPVSGSFSRTAINYTAGAKTGISNVIASLTVIIALLFLTPLFTYIPRAVLAAIVITAVWLLFNPRQVFSLWKVNRNDGIVAVMVFVLSLLTKPDYALLIGVLVALIFFVWKTMHPRIVRIAKDPEKNIFLNADRYEKSGCPQMLQLRLEGPIYFANAEYTAKMLLEKLDEQKTPIKFMLLDFQGMGFIDVTGVEELKILLDELRTRGVQLILAGAHVPVKEVLEKSGFLKELGISNLFYSKGDAFSHMFKQLNHNYCKGVCPYKLFMECSAVK